MWTIENAVLPTKPLASKVGGPVAKLLTGSMAPIAQIDVLSGIQGQGGVYESDPALLASGNIFKIDLGASVSRLNAVQVGTKTFLPVSSAEFAELGTYWQDGQNLYLLAGGAYPAAQGTAIAIDIEVSELVSSATNEIVIDLSTSPAYTIRSINAEGLSYTASATPQTPSPGEYGVSNNILRIVSSDGAAPVFGSQLQILGNMAIAAPTPSVGWVKSSLSEQGLIGVDQVIGQDRAYTPLETYSSPTPGSFVYDRRQQTLVTFVAPKPVYASIPSRIVGRQVFFANAIVNNPPDLPCLKLGHAKLSLTDGFEEQPTATLTFDAVLEENIETLRTAYKQQKSYTIFGIQYEVSAYGDIRHKIPIHFLKDNDLSERYSVQVEFVGIWSRPVKRNVYLKPLVRSLGLSLVSSQGYFPLSSLAYKARCEYIGPAFNVLTEAEPNKNATVSLSSVLEEAARINYSYICFTDPKGVRLKKLNSGRTWNFVREAVIDEGILLEQDLPGYNATTLDGYFANKIQEEFAGYEPLNLNGPREQTLTEGDEDPELPPLDSLVLRDLSSNADFSGPTKIKIVRKELNGVPLSEETYLYGFVYLGSDIYVAGTEGLMFSSNAKAFWKIVEYKKTTYLYEGIKPFNLSTEVRDPATNGLIPVYTDPRDNEGDLDVQSYGSGISVSSRAQYLVGEQVTGFQITRFAKEEVEDGVPLSIQFRLDSTRASDPVEAAKLSTIKFFRLPIFSLTQYDLQSERKYYPDGGGDPIAIETVKANTVDPDKARRMGVISVSSKGYIAIAKPSATYKENMLIMAESVDERGFAYRADPESTRDEPRKLLTTGKETINRVNRRITSPILKAKSLFNTPDRFIENTREFTASDPGFAASIEQLRYKEQLGRPPSSPAKELKFSTEQTPLPRKANKYSYLIFSDTLDSEIALGGSKSYGNAQTLSEAIAAAKADLTIETLKAQTIRKKISWTYPELRSGDFVVIDGVKYFVMRVGHSLTFNGEQPVGLASTDNFCISEGVELQLAKWVERSVSVQVRLESGADASLTPEVEILGSGTSTGGIGKVPDAKTRRKF